MARIKKYTSSNPQELGRQIRSEKELRRLYNSRMDSVRKRVGRLESKFGEDAVTTNTTELPTRSRGLSRSEMLQGISAANRYLKSKSSTIGGYTDTLRQERESLRNYGIDVPLKDLPKVNQFLDQIRADNLGSMLPSDQIISAATRAAKRGFTYAQLKANVEYFASNPGARYLKADRGSSSDDY